MKQRFNKYKSWLIAALLTTTLAVVAVPAPAGAQLFENSVGEACKGAALSDLGTCNVDKAENKVNRAITNGINIFSMIIGVIAVVMVMIAGVKYITSTGDPNSVNSAKNTLLYAVIGLVVVALAQVIVRFVLTQT